MKTLQRRLQQAAREAGLSQLVVERDYIQGYVLLGIASQPELGRALVFKGGTALKKIYFGDYRFSANAREARGPRLGSLPCARLP